MQQFAPSRKRVAILLSVLLLFFGVALFSGLHRHQSGVCSLHDLEHQIISLAEAAVVLDPSTVFLEAETPQQTQPPGIRHTLPARGRAPPAHS